jgi:hypothetical protein
MLPRHHWITEFIGYVLRGGLSNDPDWAFDTASELYPERGDKSPQFAADSASVPKARSREIQCTSRLDLNWLDTPADDPPRAIGTMTSGIASRLTEETAVHRVSSSPAAAP